MNTLQLYTEVPLAYDLLRHFCESKKFKIDPSSKEFFVINAKKRSFFFWRTLRMKFEITAIEKKQVHISAEIMKNGNRQFQLENDFMKAIEKLF